jgi:DHA1 family bicyclomycin/chloramphenicol resistance-like MFS transporter
MAGLALAGVATVAAVIVPIALFLTTFGFVVPSGTAAALTPFPHSAGAAASLLGFIQQTVAVATTLVIAALGATQTVMAVTVLVAGIGVLASFLVLVRPARRQTRVARQAAQ